MTRKPWIDPKLEKQIIDNALARWRAEDAEREKNRRFKRKLGDWFAFAICGLFVWWFVWWLRSLG